MAFEVKVRSWINQAKRSIEEQQDQRSNISLGSRKSSVLSKRFKLSNSSVRSALAKERARTAELKAKALMLEKGQTSKNEMEKIELEEEIAVAKARELIFTKEAEQEIFTETRNTKMDSDRFEHNVSVPNASNTEQRVQDVKPNIFSEEKSEVRRP